MRRLSAGDAYSVNHCLNSTVNALIGVRWLTFLISTDTDSRDVRSWTIGISDALTVSQSFSDRIAKVFQVEGVDTIK